MKPPSPVAWQDRSAPSFRKRFTVNEIQKILETSTPPNGGVSSELLPLVYDELRSLAAKRLAKENGDQTLQATALVHEAWLSMSGSEEHLWNDRAHFFRSAAWAMRRILVQRARAKSSLKRSNRKEPIDIDTLDFADTSVDERVLFVDEIMTRLEKEHPESAQLVSLKFFGGLTSKEIAATEGVAERTIERRWAYAKARLLQIYFEEL